MCMSLCVELFGAVNSNIFTYVCLFTVAIDDCVRRCTYNICTEIRDKMRQWNKHQDFTS